MNNYSRHQLKLKEIIAFCQPKFPNIRFFPRHVGLYLTMLGDKIQINRPGMADIYALCSINIKGKRILIHIEIEIKTGTGGLTEDQENWKKFIESFGGLFIIGRQPDQVSEEIQKYLDSISAGINGKHS